MISEIKETLDGRYEVTVYIDHQSFSLESQETKEEAEFFHSQFNIAINRFIENTVPKAINDEWKISVDKVIARNGYCMVPRFDMRKFSKRVARKLIKLRK